MNSAPISFDQQAATFDGRTGLSTGVAEVIANTVIRIAGLTRTSRIVEIGAGTGEIGIHLSRQCDNYLGLDASSKMLDVFAERTGPERRANMVCADANQSWPVDSGTVHAVFGSRVFHLLDVEHVAREVVRIADSGGAVFLMGRVVREPNSIKSQMRKRMRQLLKERGLEPRQGGRRTERLAQALSAYGSILPPVVAARWNADFAPIESINGWAGKQTMGGIEPPADDKRVVIDQLREWAIRQFGDLEAQASSEEHYILEGVILEGVILEGVSLAGR